MTVPRVPKERMSDLELEAVVLVSCATRSSLIFSPSGKSLLFYFMYVCLSHHQITFRYLEMWVTAFSLLLLPYIFFQALFSFIFFHPLKWLPFTSLVPGSFSEFLCKGQYPALRLLLWSFNKSWVMQTIWRRKIQHKPNSCEPEQWVVDKTMGRNL